MNQCQSIGGVLWALARGAGLGLLALVTVACAHATDTAGGATGGAPNAPEDPADLPADEPPCQRFGGEPGPHDPRCEICWKTYFFPDEDGDGHGARMRYDEPGVPFGCRGDSLPEGYAYGNDDCDDSDPSIHTIVRRDEDGDGYVLEDSDVCGDPNRPGDSLSTRVDCDDTNPETTYWQWTDDDGDGFGAGVPSCVPPEPSLAALGGDCDEDDPGRHPKAVELWGDGIDSDCDGGDDSACATNEELPSVAPAAACDGPDLFWTILGDCTYCSTPDVTVTLGNQGSSRAQGALEIATPSATVQTLELDLDPGAFTAPLTVHERNVELIFDGDCNPENNLLEFGFCTVP